MNSRRFTLEIFLYGLALILAVCLRLADLGRTPLSDPEATLALQARQISQTVTLTTGDHPTLAAHPGYILLTGLVFALFKDSNTLARLWPALAGSLLVLAPFFLSRKPTPGLIPPIAGIILAFGLATDPGLVTISRQAGGPMMAVSFSILAISLWMYQKPLLAGIMAGLALLSGPMVIPVGLTIALAWLLVRFLGYPRLKPIEQEAVIPTPEASREHTDDASVSQTWLLAPSSPQSNNRVLMRVFMISVGVVILVAGTLFLRFPEGLAAWVQEIPAYLNGWTTPTGIPGSKLIVTLAIYQPLALLFGLVGAIRSFFNPKARSVNAQGEHVRATTLILILWAILALLVQSLYPGRQVSDLAWVLVPLWGLAAMELERFWPEKSTHPVSLAQAILTLILLALLWFNLATMVRYPTDSREFLIREAVLLGILALIGLTAALVALGWSWQVSQRGLVFGTGAALCIYTISVLWGASYLRMNQPQELWNSSPGIGQADLLQSSLHDLTNWHSGGDPKNIDLVVTVDSTALRWLLRDYIQAKFITQIGVENLPAVLITPQTQSLPTLVSSYRGQDFVWWTRPGWQAALPAEFLPWFTYRDAPVAEEKIILWVRSDLFPGDSTNGQPEQ